MLLSYLHAYWPKMVLRSSQRCFHNKQRLSHYLQCMEDCCGGVNLPPELLQDIIHFIHHLLANSAPGLDRLETLQKLKSSISTP